MDFISTRIIILIIAVSDTIGKIPETYEVGASRNTMEDSSSATTPMAGVMGQSGVPNNDSRVAMSPEHVVGRKKDMEDGDKEDESEFRSSPTTEEKERADSDIQGDGDDDDDDEDEDDLFGSDSEGEEDAKVEQHDVPFALNESEEDHDFLEDSNHEPESNEQPEVQTAPAAAKPQSILKQPSIASRQNKTSSQIKGWFSKPTKTIDLNKQKKLLEARKRDKNETEQANVASSVSTDRVTAPQQSRPTVPAGTEEEVEEDGTSPLIPKVKAAPVTMTIEEDTLGAEAQGSTHSETSSEPSNSFDTPMDSVDAAIPDAEVVVDVDDVIVLDDDEDDTDAKPQARDPKKRKDSVRSLALGIDIAKDKVVKAKQPAPPASAAVGRKFKKKLLAKKTVKKAEAIKKEQAAATAAARKAASKQKPVKKGQKVKHESGAKGDRVKSELTYEGIPQKPFPGGWPPGWIERRYKRQGGQTKGSDDSYFFAPPPNEKHKLRSVKEVQRYIFALNKSGGDAAVAWSQRTKGPTE